MSGHTPWSQIKHKRDKPNKWETADPCDRCGQPYDTHTFKEAVACIYWGTELKDGGTFDQDTANEIVDRIADKL